MRPRMTFDVIRDRVNASRDHMNTSRDQVNASRDRMNASSDSVNASRDRVNASRDRMNASSDRVNVSRDRMNASSDRMNASSDRVNASRDRVNASRDHRNASRDRMNASMHEVHVIPGRHQRVKCLRRQCTCFGLVGLGLTRAARGDAPVTLTRRPPLSYSSFVSTAPDRDSLHRLIDALRPDDIPTAERVLQALNVSSDPLLATLANAPVDDEAETDSEREATERARRDVRDGKTVSHEEISRKLRRA